MAAIITLFVIIAAVGMVSNYLGFSALAADNFYAYAFDNNGLKIDSWYSADEGKYYLFMTAETDIQNVELYYLSAETNENNDFIEKSLPQAFATSEEININDTSCGNVDIVAMKSDVPSLYIDLNGTTLSEIHADKDIKHPNNTVTIEDPIGGNDLNANKVEIKGRGNSSWDWFDKKGYQIKFDKKTSVLGMPKAKKWCLLANASDDSMVKNYLSLNLAKDLGLDYAVDCRYVDLWVEGEYRGLYLLTSKVEIGGNRVDMVNDDGALFEWDQAFYNDEDYWFCNHAWDTYFTVKESVNESPENINAVMNDFDKALTEFADYLNTTSRTQITLSDLEKYIDVKSFAIYYLTNEYTLNAESVVTSFYWYRDGASDVIHLGPVWDFDTCMNISGDDSYTMYHANKSSIFRTLLSIPVFNDYVENMYYSQSNLFFSMDESALSLQNKLCSSANMNYKKWNVLGKSNPKGGVYASSYDEAISKVSNWLGQRQNVFVPSREIGYTYVVKGTELTVTAYPVDNYSSASFALWSDENGQDDIHWYNALRNDDGSWFVTVSLYDFNDAGWFTIHFYNEKASVDGKKIYINSLPEKNILTTTVSPDCTEMNVVLSNVGKDYDIMYFPTWSEYNGQDDIVWYQAEKNADASWSCNVDLRAHNSAGYYATHVYGEKNGAKELIAYTSTFVSKAVSYDTVKATVTSDCTEMKIVLSDVGKDYDIMYFPTWSEYNGQDDIVWYQAEKNADGSWSCNVDLRAHNSAGYYATHVYGEKNGVKELIAYTSTFVSKAVSYDTVRATVSSDCTEMKIVLSDVGKDYDTIYFPTWSEYNGQDDIVWYQAERNADGSWSCNVDLRAHNSAGYYVTHVYGEKNGVKELIAYTSTFVSKAVSPAVVKATVTSDCTEMDIVFTDAKSEYDNVYFPTWSEYNGQDDIVWYQAERNTNGSWSCNVDLRAHNSAGYYAIHVYGEKNGVMELIANTTQYVRTAA